MRGTTLCVLIVVAVAASAENAHAPASEILGLLLADPNDCTAYYQFTPQRKICPVDLVFNSKKQMCDWPHNAACPCNGRTVVPVRGTYYASGDFRGWTAVHPTTPKTGTHLKEAVNPGTDTARRTPPADYTHLPGVGYYKRHEEGKTWDVARRVCETEGGYLAIPDSLQELDAISNQFGCCPWIGIYRGGPNRPWITVLGKPISSGFPIWKVGQPASSLCAHLSDKGGGISAKDACEVSGRFLCEFQG